MTLQLQKFLRVAKVGRISISVPEATTACQISHSLLPATQSPSMPLKSTAVAPPAVPPE
jgi:hypothetical protein